MNPALADQHPDDTPAGDPGGHAARRDGPRLAAGRPRPSRHRPPAARITPDTTPVSLTHRSLPSEASRPGPGTRAGLGHRRADSAADGRVPHRRPPGRRAVLPPAVWRFPLLRHGTIGAFLNTAATSSARPWPPCTCKAPGTTARWPPPSRWCRSASPWSQAQPWPRPPCTGSGPYGGRRGLPAQLNTPRAREKATRSRRPADCALCG
jgi:hypothetical protein